MEKKSFVGLPAYHNRKKHIIEHMNLNFPKPGSQHDAMWDHLDREWNKRQPMSKDELKSLELILKTAEESIRKFCSVLENIGGQIKY